ncbi:MAG: type II secretion system protein N [Pseudomonadota bacterium]
MEQLAATLGPYSKRLATLASVVLVILMSLSVANTALFFLENIQDDAIAPVPVAANQNRKAPVSDVDISALNLFGRVEQIAAPQVVEAPQTNLNLELQGVFTAEDPDDSTAIVAERNKTGELFQIGDRLPGNAILDAVFDDHILIRRGARVEKLMFSDAALRAPAAAATGRVGINPALVSPPTTAMDDRLQNVRERIAARRQEAATTPVPASGPSSAGSALRDYVSTYREQIEADPQAVLNQLGVSPVSEGEAMGYRIAGDIPEQALRQSGLQRGDVILSVNGAPVGNVVNDQALIDQAMAAGRVRVEVQRNERKFFLTVPIP